MIKPSPRFVHHNGTRTIPFDQIMIAHMVAAYGFQLGSIAVARDYAVINFSDAESAFAYMVTLSRATACAYSAGDQESACGTRWAKSDRIASATSADWVRALVDLLARL